MEAMSRQKVLFLQLPIPPVGPTAIRGNVPLAAGYLIMYAKHCGLDQDYDFSILEPSLANQLSEQGLVDEILGRNPDIVAFSCYLWNIDRSLWIAQALRAQRPNLTIVIGGPEVTADNQWVLNHPAVNYAVCGEGEQTFAELLVDLKRQGAPKPGLLGLYARGRTLGPPPFRPPLSNLDVVSSPYLAGIIDAADERMMLIETIRGCIFKCKFCYYPKSYDDLYFVSMDKVIANLKHAAEKNVTEIVLLDPTLNQRRDFHGFLKLLADHNPNKQWTYFGELRGEGITAETARLLKAANFTEVEIGLQSVDPHAQTLMDRKNSMKAFERGAKAMLDVGINVKVDLIVGLPGDTEQTVRDGLNYLHRTGLYDDVQVFQLAILPGTAFREEAQQLGLRFQPRPPYYVLETPTLKLPQMIELMAEAQELFGCEFDAPPMPALDFPPTRTIGSTPHCRSIVDCIKIDFEDPAPINLPDPVQRAQALTLILRARNWDHAGPKSAELIETILRDNPHHTLQMVLIPTAGITSLDISQVQTISQASLADPSYLDRFYAMQPGRAMGAKRIVIQADLQERLSVDDDWLEAMGSLATFAWTNPPPAASTDDFFHFEELVDAATSAS